MYANRGTALYRHRSTPIIFYPFTVLLYYFARKVLYKKHWGPLSPEGLSAPLEGHSSVQLGDNIERLWKKELSKKDPSILRMLFKAYGWPLLGFGVATFVVEAGLRFFQPLFLGQVIRYFSTGGTETTLEDAYMYAVVLILDIGLVVMIEHVMILYRLHMGKRLRVGLDALIFRKILRLKASYIDENSYGFLMDTICVDAAKCDYALNSVHYLWIGPLETILVSYFIWEELGTGAIFGILCFLLTIPLQAILGQRAAYFRKRLEKKSDRRVGIMSEIIKGIQVIKLFSWEAYFSTAAKTAYREEMKELRYLNSVKGVMVSFVHVTTRLSVFCTCISYVLMEHDRFTPKNVFVVTSLFELLRISMTIMFPKAICETQEGLFALRRIQEVLQFNEAPQPNYRYKASEEETDENVKSKRKKIVIRLTNVSSKWDDKQIQNTVNNATTKVREGKLVIVAGGVSSGKTSLLLTILGELHVTGGNLYVGGKMSYSSQHPWIFAGTIKENILFDLPYDEERYNEVIDICALRYDLQEFPDSDDTQLLSGGITLSGGQRSRINLARAIYRDADIYLLDNPLAEQDSHVSKRLFEDCITHFLKNKTVILVTQNIQLYKQADKILLMKDGTIFERGNYQKMKPFLPTEFYENPDKMPEEKFPSAILRRRRFEKSTREEAVDFERIEITIGDELRFAKVATKFLSEYIGGGRNWFAVIVVLVLCITAQLAGTGCDFWISQWANINEFVWKMQHNITQIKITDPPDIIFHRNTCVMIYVSIMVTTIVLTIVRTFAFYHVSMRRAERLHNALIDSILHATMHFFYKNPPGTLLDTFTSNVRVIQEKLPPILMSCVQGIIMGVLIMCVIGVVNLMVLLATAFLIGLGLLLRKIYIGSSRSLKTQEGIYFNSLIQCVSTTIQGLATIRACNAQQTFMEVYHLHQDRYASTLYLRIAMNQAFEFYFDSMCLTYSIAVIVSFLFAKRDYFGGDVGLVITQCVVFTTVLYWGVTQVTELESELLAVQSISQIIATRPEYPFQSARDRVPPPDWPDTGKIKFHKVKIKYEQMGLPKLKDLNFVINPAEKIGIVGRSGCGKSTLIRALFCLHNIEGTISIDGINIMQIGLNDLRKKITIIPQEPVIFKSTLRKNLDPNSEYSDSDLWDALEKVGMRKTLRNLKLDLYTGINERGITFSFAQRQLLCVARAILRKNKILIMDGALSHTDLNVERMVLRRIKRIFEKSTIITISHKLHSVINSDRIMVLVDGTMTEFDHPYVLLNNTSGDFFRLAQETGDTMMRFLFWKAKRNYQEMMGSKYADDSPPRRHKSK